MFIIDRVLTNDFEKEISSRKRSLKSLKIKPLRTRLISNFDDVLLAVNEVYSKPFTSRLIKGHGCIPSAKLNALRINIAHKIYNYFTSEPNTVNSQINYDEFHDNLVKFFCNVFNSLSVTYGASPIKYGHGQKLINMVFKYLACYSDYSTYADLFSYCHIPIDSILLENLGLFGVPHINISMKTYKGLSWSNLEENDYKELVENYRTILRSITVSNLPWLSIDFIVWYAGISGKPIVFPIAGTHTTPINSFYE